VAVGNSFDVKINCSIVVVDPRSLFPVFDIISNTCSCFNSLRNSSENEALTKMFILKMCNMASATERLGDIG